DFVEMILAKCKNIHQDLRFLSEELYEGVSRFPNCVKLNELIKKFEEDFRKKVLEQNDDDDDTTGIPKELPYGTGKETRIVAYPSVAANVDQASPTAQRS
ncbi:hypothetical protein Tco_0029150, partial [Tanacetum coccineum]